MGKEQQYRLRQEFCLINAAKAPHPQLRQLWVTMAESYALLEETDVRLREGYLPLQMPMQSKLSSLG
jgi:hypothetical protein